MDLCTACPEDLRTSQFIIAAAVLALIAIVIVLLLLPAGRQVSLVKLVILVNLVQFIALLSDVQSKWPPEIQQIFNTLSFANINLDLLAPGCVAQITFYTEMLLTTGAPIALLMIIVVIYVGAKIFFVLRRDPRARFLQVLRYKSYRSALIILVLCYILVSKKAFAYFNCQAIDGDTYVVRFECAVP